MTAQNAVVLATVALIVSACVAPPPLPPLETSPPYIINLDRFEPVPDFQVLPNPESAAEREVLARLEQELTLLQRLAREAQSQRNKAARLQFRYDLLQRDLDTVRHGIRQHLQGPGSEPRTFAPLRGDYRGG